MAIKKSTEVSFPSFEIVSSFQGDPFVGHLSTPITTSNFTSSYLSLLPIYKEGLSPLLRGMQIGLVHGYFLFGPFFSLGPLRSSEINAFIAFLSVSSLLIILTIGLLLYGFVTLSDTLSREEKFTKESWKQFSSGFLVGGFGGVSFAYTILKMLDLSFLSNI